VLANSSALPNACSRINERSGFSLYFPLMTSLIISVVLSVILWPVNR
jgi:hypothetical protein